MTHSTETNFYTDEALSVSLSAFIVSMGAPGKIERVLPPIELRG